MKDIFTQKKYRHGREMITEEVNMGGPQLLLPPASLSDRLKSTINNKRLGFAFLKFKW